MLQILYTSFFDICGMRGFGTHASMVLVHIFLFECGLYILLNYQGEILFPFNEQGKQARWVKV